MNPWHDVRQLHAASNALFALTLLAVLVAGVVWLVHRPAFMLRTVSIEPAEDGELVHTSAALLRKLALHRVRGSFFTVDLDAVRAGFETVPWVRRATVRRVWPDALRVTIEEHRAMALWGDGRLMNTDGELFTANLDEAEAQGPLPEFSGPQGSQLAVLGRYRELVGWLKPMDRRPVAVTLSSRYAWSARLDDGTTVLLGREQGTPLETRVSRWVAAYPRVRPRLDRHPEVVDLRYPNGFAVRAGVAAVGKPSASGAVIQAGHRR